MGIVTGIEERLMIYLHPESDGAEAVWLNVREFCKRHSLNLIRTGPADLERRLGDLTGIAKDLNRTFAAGDTDAPGDTDSVEAFEAVETAGRKGADAEAPQQTLYLLCGFEPTARDRLLKAMREEEIGAGDLKAMATDSNLNWTLRHLLKDVAAEHEIMQAYMALRHTLRVMDVLIETVGLPPQAKAAFDERMAMARAMTADGRVPEDVETMRRLDRELKILITMGESDDL